MSADSLVEENNALRIKVQALEQELKLRTEENTKLRAELRELAEIKQKSESQSKSITALTEELEVARVAHASAVEALEEMRKKLRDREHKERIQRTQAILDGNGAVGGLSAHSGANAGGNFVPTTAAAPQIIDKNSDISFLGFSKQQRPVDFLCGVGNSFGGSNNARGGEADEGEVARLMDMVKDSVLMDIQYSEIGEKEERELQRRFEALRRP